MLGTAIVFAGGSSGAVYYIIVVRLLADYVPVDVTGSNYSWHLIAVDHLPRVISLAYKSRIQGKGKSDVRTYVRTSHLLTQRFEQLR